MDLKAKAGDPITANFMNRIIDRLPNNADGFGVGGFRLSQTAVLTVNDSGANRDVGDLVVLTGFDGATTSIFDAMDSVVFTAESPTWHTAIASVGVYLEPTPVDERGMVAVSGMAMVKLDAAPQANHTHVFVDDTSTNQCKPSYSGFGKILSSMTVDGSEFAVVSIGDCQNLWRYELLADSAAPGPTNATLHDRRGNSHGTISLLDPLGLMSDQKTGDKGWCINCGNEFEAIQAPCG